VVGGRRPLPPTMGDGSDPPPSKIAPSTDFRLTSAIFTGLRFEVEQASRGLSPIAELLVLYCVYLTYVRRFIGHHQRALA